MRSGFVTVLGRPNVGKSTLVNRLVGEKISIVSPKPQTTRDAIQGVVTRAEGQIVFVDSPGIHRPSKQLGRRMEREIQRAASGCHLALYVIDVSRRDPGPEREPIQRLVQLEAPVFLVLNKIDRLEDKRLLLPLIDAFRQAFDFAEYVPVSARSGDGLDRLVQLIFERLPEAQPFYPPDFVTDQPERFLAAELIRERVLYETRQEVPHSTFVAIDQWEESPKLLRLSAIIYVERPGQKAIVIGKGGAMLKQIGVGARLELEQRFGKKVFLELFVKVKPKWRDRPAFMRTLDEHRYGYGSSEAEQPILFDRGGDDPLT